MGRIRLSIDVDGHSFWTLFDTGSRNTYVTREVASLLGTSELKHPKRTALGGSVQELRESALLQAEIEGHSIETQTYVLEAIGNDEDGRPIEVLLGALAMQQWGIRPIPDQERLDMSHYSSEFLEF